MKTLKWTVVILLALCVWATYANSGRMMLIHENSGMTHSKGGTGHCHGWEVIGEGMRLCFMDKEHTMCKRIVHNHDIWHESEPFPCPTEEEEECYDGNGNPTPFNLEQCEGLLYD